MRQKGNNVVLSVALMIIAIMFGTFAIDVGTYFNIHTQMQTAADSAALAAAQEMFKVQEPDPSTRLDLARQEAIDYANMNWSNILEVSDVEFGYVDPNTLEYDEATFDQLDMNSYPETNGANAVRVTMVRDAGSTAGQIPTSFANIFGIQGMDATAQAVSVFPGQPTAVTGGMRPFFMCQAAWEIAVSQFNDPTVPEITFYGDTFSVGGTTYDNGDYCPCNASAANAFDVGTNKDGTVALIRPNGKSGQSTIAMYEMDWNSGELKQMLASNGNGGGNGGGGNGCDNPPGSFGLVDLTGANGAPGANQVRDWIENGYDGTVAIGNVLNPQPGTGGLNSASSELQGLVNSQEVFTVPLYDSSSGSGSNAEFDISGIAAFQLTSFEINGNSSTLTGHFRKKVCSAAMCSYEGDQVNGVQSLSTVRLVN